MARASRLIGSRSTAAASYSVCKFEPQWTLLASPIACRNCGQWIPGRKDTTASEHFRAIADHLARRQREADGEVEKRAIGDHSPTFLEAEPLTDVHPVGAKKPPKFAPEYIPVASLDAHAGIDEDGNSLTLHDIVAASEQQWVSGNEAVEAINQGRQSMSRAEDIAADVAIETLRGKSFSLSDLAAKLKTTKSGASKV